MKSGKKTRRSAWMNRELLAKLGHRKGSIQRVGARMGNVRRIQKYLSIQG